MVRLTDPQALRAHQARFDLGRLSREGLTSLDARRLDALLDRPYEDLSEREVAHALDLTARSAGLPAWFAYFLPATLRAYPSRDPVVGERFLAGMLAARSEPSVADWDPEIESVLERALSTRPLRGGDDPVDLWLPERAAPRADASGWACAWEGPLYVRLALLLLERYPAVAVDRLRSWESSSDDNLSRAWVETMFHGHGVGWRAAAPGATEILRAPERAVRAESLSAHPAVDVSIGAAAVLRLIAPPRFAAVRDRVLARVSALDASDSDRFVITRPIRRLLTGD